MHPSKQQALLNIEAALLRLQGGGSVKQETKTYYWSFIDWDCDMVDIEAESQKEAQASAEMFWEQRCEDECLRGTHQEKIELVRFDADTMEIVERVPSRVYWEYYHGDFAEHNTLGR